MPNFCASCLNAAWQWAGEDQPKWIDEARFFLPGGVASQERVSALIIATMGQEIAPHDCDSETPGGNCNCRCQWK